MLARLALLALALGVLPTAAQTPTPVLDGRLVVEVPEGLDRLTEAQLLAKYGAARKPADGFGDAILAVTVTATAQLPDRVVHLTRTLQLTIQEAFRPAGAEEKYLAVPGE
uniref:hypothetical protein n=1 Tax=uncultured Nocardioides sp. TaxID=198441 RepID=UPI00260FB101